MSLVKLYTYEYGSFTMYGRKVMKLICYYSMILFFPNINVISFKVIPLSNYTRMETLFPLVVAALEVFNRYGVQHVRYSFGYFPNSRNDVLWGHFLIRKKTRTEVRWIGRLGNHRNAFYSQKYYYGEDSVTWGVVIMEHPFVCNVWYLMRMTLFLSLSRRSL